MRDARPGRPAGVRRAAAALLALACTAVHAAGDEALKNAAVGGTLLSWAAALWVGAPLTRCDDTRWRLRVAAAQGDELQQVQVGAARGRCALFDAGPWSLSHTPTLTLAHWRADDGPYARHAFDVAAVPMLHWRAPMPGTALAFDVELGIGAAWLSRKNIGTRAKGSHFQFSDHLGFGIGEPGGRWRVGFTYRHVSNGDLTDDNDAVDFKGVVFEWRAFDGR